MHAWFSDAVAVAHYFAAMLQGFDMDYSNDYLTWMSSGCAHAAYVIGHALAMVVR